MTKKCLFMVDFVFQLPFFNTLGRVLLTPLNFSDFSELVTNR